MRYGCLCSHHHDETAKRIRHRVQSIAGCRLNQSVQMDIAWAFICETDDSERNLRGRKWSDVSDGAPDNGGSSQVLVRVRGLLTRVDLSTEDGYDADQSMVKSTTCTTASVGITG